MITRRQLLYGTGVAGLALAVGSCSASGASTAEDLHGAAAVLTLGRIFEGATTLQMAQKVRLIVTAQGTVGAAVTEVSIGVSAGPPWRSSTCSTIDRSSCGYSTPAPAGPCSSPSSTTPPTYPAEAQSLPPERDAMARRR